jgi:hypothetical protein
MSIKEASVIRCPMRFAYAERAFAGGCGPVPAQLISPPSCPVTCADEPACGCAAGGLATTRAGSGLAGLTAPGCVEGTGRWGLSAGLHYSRAKGANLLTPFSMPAT